VKLLKTERKRKKETKTKEKSYLLGNKFMWKLMVCERDLNIVVCIDVCF